MPKSSTGKEKEKKGGLKASLANLAHEYSNIKQDPLRFPFGKEHTTALCELQNNKEIRVTRPGKGNGTVLMNKTDYIARMMEILGDETKSSSASEAATNMTGLDRLNEHYKLIYCSSARQVRSAVRFMIKFTQQSLFGRGCTVFLRCTSLSRFRFVRLCRWSGVLSISWRDG